MTLTVVRSANRARMGLRSIHAEKCEAAKQSSAFGRWSGDGCDKVRYGAHGPTCMIPLSDLERAARRHLWFQRVVPGAPLGRAGVRPGAGSLGQGPDAP